MRLLSALLMASAVSSPASADWQWTRWGMSPAEVRAASPGTLTELDSAQQRNAALVTGEEPLLRLRHVAAGIPWTTLLYFRNGQLSSVALQAERPGDASAAITALSLVYGPPLREPDNTVGGCTYRSLYWTDPQPTTRLRLTSRECPRPSTGAGFVYVTYRPVPDRSQSGF